MKKYLLGLFAVVLAVGLSAFNSQKNYKPANLVVKYFTYDAYPSDDPNDLNDPANYSPTGNSGQDELTCPDGQTHRCGVQATDDGSNQPILSGATIFKRN